MTKQEIELEQYRISRSMQRLLKRMQAKTDALAALSYCLLNGDYEKIKL